MVGWISIAIAGAVAGVGKGLFGYIKNHTTSADQIDWAVLGRTVLGGAVVGILISTLPKELNPFGDNEIAYGVAGSYLSEILGKIYVSLKTYLGLKVQWIGK